MQLAKNLLREGEDPSRCTRRRVSFRLLHQRLELHRRLQHASRRPAPTLSIPNPLAVESSILGLRRFEQEAPAITARSVTLVNDSHDGDQAYATVTVTKATTHPPSGTRARLDPKQYAQYA